VLRRALLAVSASDRIRRIITAAPIARDMVARFVAGDDAGDALSVARRLVANGLLVTLDFLGEDTTDPQQAAAVSDEYARLLGRLADAGLAARGRAEISVKPSAVGLGLSGCGEKTATENISRICAAAGTPEPRSPWTWKNTPGWTPPCAS
jgi:proline dehydrogenase